MWRQRRHICGKAADVAALDQGLQRRVSEKGIDMCTKCTYLCTSCTDMCTPGSGRPWSRLPLRPQCLLRFAQETRAKSTCFLLPHALLRIRAPERRVPCSREVLFTAKSSEKHRFRGAFLHFLLGLVPPGPHFVKVRKHVRMHVFTREARKHESTRRHPWT